MRGGNYNVGTDAGVFNFNNTNGNANGDRSFRLVLADYVKVRKILILNKSLRTLKNVFHRNLIPFWLSQINT